MARSNPLALGRDLGVAVRCADDQLHRRVTLALAASEWMGSPRPRSFLFGSANGVPSSIWGTPWVVVSAAKHAI